MITDKSCGTVVYIRVNHQLFFVIIENHDGIFGFPKGHVEENESELETAFREVKEEIGIDVTFDSHFRRTPLIQYQIKKISTKRLFIFLVFLKSKK